MKIQKDRPSERFPASASSVNLLRGTAVVSCLNQLSRVLGFIRDVLTARLLGAGLVADAFFVAFRIPNLLRSFVAEGALTSAFVPVFASELAQGRDQAVRTIRSVTSLLMIATSVLTVLGVLFAPQVVDIFAPGFRQIPDKVELCSQLTKIMMPYIICVSLIAMLNGALNTVNVFGVSAMAQVWMNVVLIAGVLVADWFNESVAAMLLALSVLLGGIVQVVAQIPAMRRAGFFIIPSRHAITPATKQIMLLMLPAIVGATVYQFQILMNTMLASSLVNGSVTWLYYADRLAQFPIGVFSISLASVLLPALSRAAAEDDKAQFAQHLGDSLRYTSFVIVPVSFALYYFAEPLINVVLERGAFTHEATIQTARALQAYSVGIWAMSCHTMLIRVFIARKDTYTPTLIGCLTLINTFLFSLMLMGPPVSLEHTWLYNKLEWMQGLVAQIAPTMALGHAGLAWASSIAVSIAVILVMILVHLRIHLDWKPYIGATLRAVAASVAMVAILQFSGLSAYSPIKQLIVGGVTGIVVYFACLWALRAREMRETWNVCTRIIHRHV